MDYYETVMIFNAKTLEKDRMIEAEMNKFKDIFQSYSTKKKIKAEYMGEKRLAYEIHGFKTGYYLIVTWQGTTDNVHEAERQMRIDDHVLKFMTVKREDYDEDELEDHIPNDEELIKLKSEQKPKPDALDVLLGFADYDTQLTNNEKDDIITAKGGEKDV